MHIEIWIIKLVSILVYVLKYVPLKKGPLVCADAYGVSQGDSK